MVFIYFFVWFFWFDVVLGRVEMVYLGIVIYFRGYRFFVFGDGMF